MQALAIDVTNFGQLSGLLVVSNPYFGFYSEPSADWRCTPAEAGDTDLSWTLPTFDDSDWQIPTSLGRCNVTIGCWDVF